jgi:hypothetical protein
MARYDRMLLEHFQYRGFHGCPCVCSLEILRLADGRTAVIATELEDNPGTSVTNVAGHLASEVCDRFGIDPKNLVWIEHYGYAGSLEGTRERTYDRVTLQFREPDRIRWAPSVSRHKPDGWPGYFEEPQWRPMKEADWRELGLPPKPPVIYKV